MHLQRTVDDTLGVFGGHHLGHRCFARGARSAGVTQPRRAVGQQRSGIDVGRHVAEGRLAELEIGQALREHASCLRMYQRLVERTPRKAQGRRSDAGAEDVQRAHRQLEAVTGLAQALQLGHAAVVEAQTCERVRSDHLDTLGDLQAGRAGVHNVGAEALCAACGGLMPSDAVTRKDAIDVRDTAVADPRLFAVQHHVVTIIQGAAGHCRHIAAGFRLAQCKGRDALTARDTRQQLGLQGRAAGQRDGAAAQALHRKRKVGQAVVAGQGFAAHDQRTRVQRLAGAARAPLRCALAEHRWHAVAQEARLAQRAHQAAAAGVGVVVIHGLQVQRRPGVQFCGQRAMAFFEKRQLQMAQACGHFSSPRTSATALMQKHRRRV